MENLNVDFTDYETELTHKFKTRPPFEPKDEKQLKSVIPGTIKAVHVLAGETVNAGDSLLVEEAMKMENTILSPITGVVKVVHVRVGEMVPKNHLLVEFE